MEQFGVFKFFPDEASGYEYVAECSNRGLCDEESGECACFRGYVGDDCSQQSALAM